MSDRPTPETDAFSGNMGDCIKFAEKLERERDEAREVVQLLTDQGLELLDANRTLTRELRKTFQKVK